MAGIHLHPHDIIDEGTDQIFRFLGEMGDIDYIFPQVNTIFERNPYPAGKLPHNPVNEYVMGRGTMHVSLDTKQIYSRLYQKVDPSIQEKDPMEILQRSVDHDRYQVIPWLNLLNGDFQGVEANAVVDFRQQVAEHWLCPNGPDVVPMWSRMLSALADRYGYATFMIDRIRYPDWAGKEVKPQGIFSCFCSNCVRKMEEQGIHTQQLVEEMNVVSELLRAQQFQQAVYMMQSSDRFKQWIAFRQDSVSSFVERLKEQTARLHPNITFWLDLWPPSYAWLLGQDYSRLTKSADKLKHFPYHKLGGGADVQGFIEYFAKTPEQQEEAFRAFRSFFHLDYDITYASFKEKGYPIQFVTRENDKVRELAQPGTEIYSGIQMWNISSADLIEAVTAAKASKADHPLYYCYGWAEEEHFSAIGQWNRQLA